MGVRGPPFGRPRHDTPPAFLEFRVPRHGILWERGANWPRRAAKAPTAAAHISRR